MPVNKRPQTPRPPFDPAVVGKHPRRRWEYTTLSAERPLPAKDLDGYGADGWELVTMYVRMDAVYAVFKREVMG